jgi:hypothetical protein
MSDTTTVASSAPMTIRIYQIDKDADPDRPGAAPEREYRDIVGERHPDAVHGLGITRNVPIAMIDAWLEANPAHRDVFTKMSDDDLEKHSDVHSTFGWEPHLEAAANDADNNKLAEQGTEPPPDAPPAPRAAEPPPPGTAAAPAATPAPAAATPPPPPPAAA